MKSIDLKTVVILGLLVILAIVLINAGPMVIGWLIAGLSIGFIGGFAFSKWFGDRSLNKEQNKQEKG